MIKAHCRRAFFSDEDPGCEEGWKGLRHRWGAVGAPLIPGWRGGMLLKFIFQAGLVSLCALREHRVLEHSPELSEMEGLGAGRQQGRWMLAMAGQERGKPKKQLSVAAGFAFKTCLSLRAGGRLHTQQSCQPHIWS